MTLADNTIEAQIAKAIEAELLMQSERDREAIIVKAVEEFEVALRKRIAEVSLAAVRRSYSMQRHGQTLTIEVHLSGTN